MDTTEIKSAIVGASGFDLTYKTKKILIALVEEIERLREDLKPPIPTAGLVCCPFCGGDGESAKEFSIDRFGQEEVYFIIRCKSCGARSSRCSDNDEAEQEWNSRIG